jgi:hypothetical protein
MLIRRDAYQRLNGFTENFVGWGFEDTDFAVRAIRQLNVLNLFRTGEALLHIDHPVSPYKSEEHNENYQKFYECPESPDIERFCRHVFRGHDFSQDRNSLLNTSDWTKPLQEIAKRGIPLEVSQAEAWWLRVARQRLARHLGPLPKFIVLHGSRMEGTAGPNDDYDILAVYDGPVQEFFVPSSGTRVELECADLHRFEYVAAHPAIHSFTGPMELAKIARAELLWGNRAAFRRWTSRLLKKAMNGGWCYWLVLGLGLRRHSAKYGPMVDRYFCSLAKLRAQAIAVRQLQPNGEGDFTDDMALAIAATHALDEFRPDWRQAVRMGEALFELQVPEVWTALLYLLKSPLRLDTSIPSIAHPPLARCSAGRARAHPRGKDC